MLGEHPVYVVLLATDLSTAKDFYNRKLGLELLDESQYVLKFRCGTTQLTLSKSTTGTSDEQTQAAWMVEDLDAELVELRGRGVEIQEYDTPGLKEFRAAATDDELKAMYAYLHSLPAVAGPGAE